MATLQPFRAWHPAASTVKKVSCPPYDVISSQQARAVAQNRPESFLHITKPEIDLPGGADFDDARAYKKGAENLRRFIGDGILRQDDQPALYIYRLQWNDNIQTGIYGCVSVHDYDNGIILKHELTRPDKEDDRTRHIRCQQAHAEPVMLTCRDKGAIAAFTDDFCNRNDPLFNFTTGDGVSHSLWRVEDTSQPVKIFAALDYLYIADGHHRCKAASRAALQERNNHSEASPKAAFNYFPAVIFPMSQMNILAYNRLIHQAPDDFIKKLYKNFDAEKTDQKTPPAKGEICLYDGDSWFNIQLPQDDHPSVVEQLDVHRLQEFILQPMLSIEDPRRDKNISFIGGFKDADELEQQVQNGTAELAISMYPTGIEELVDVSDQGLLMPPKSTWFEPKLRSGLLVHTF